MKLFIDLANFFVFCVWIHYDRLLTLKDDENYVMHELVNDHGIKESELTSSDIFALNIFYNIKKD